MPAKALSSILLFALVHSWFKCGNCQYGKTSGFYISDGTRPVVVVSTSNPVKADQPSRSPVTSVAKRTHRPQRDLSYYKLRKLSGERNLGNPLAEGYPEGVLPERYPRLYQTDRYPGEFRPAPRARNYPKGPLSRKRSRIQPLPFQRNRHLRRPKRIRTIVRSMLPSMPIHLPWSSAPKQGQRAFPSKADTSNQQDQDASLTDRFGMTPQNRDSKRPLPDKSSSMPDPSTTPRALKPAITSKIPDTDETEPTLQESETESTEDSNDEESDEVLQSSESDDSSEEDEETDLPSEEDPETTPRPKQPKRGSLAARPRNKQRKGVSERATRRPRTGLGIRKLEDDPPNLLPIQSDAGCDPETSDCKPKKKPVVIQVIEILQPSPPIVPMIQTQFREKKSGFFSYITEWLISLFTDFILSPLRLRYPVNEAKIEEKVDRDEWRKTSTKTGVRKTNFDIGGDENEKEFIVSNIEDKKDFEAMPFKRNALSSSEKVQVSDSKGFNTLDENSNLSLLKLLEEFIDEENREGGNSINKEDDKTEDDS